MSARDKAETAGNFDAVAEQYEQRYPNPVAIARRQAAIVTRWGGRLRPGASVVELGCANGFAAIELARRGYRVTGVDISPAMIETANASAARAGVEATFLVGDVDGIDRLDLGPVDAVVALLGTFFHYSAQPYETLTRIAALRPRKIIVDVNRRHATLDDARAGMRRLGCDNVRWRPYVAPKHGSLPGFAYPFLGALEHRPLRALTMRLKNPNVLVCGSWR